MSWTGKSYFLAASWQLSLEMQLFTNMAKSNGLLEWMMAVQALTEAPPVKVDFYCVERAVYYCYCSSYSTGNK